MIQVNKIFLNYTNPVTDSKLAFVIQDRDLPATMDSSLKSSPCYNVKI